MASAMIGNLAVSLTMSTAAFQRGATLAEKRAVQMQGKFAGVTASLKGFGAAIGGAVIVDGMSRLVANAFEMASSLSEASQQVGVSVEALQELRFAADQSGIGADKMDATIKRLNKSLGELQLGAKPTVQAFAAIGLSADELRGKSPDQALRLIADALNTLPDASQRVAIGQQLMGRSFSDLLPLINGGSAALDQYAEASRKNGQISSEDAARLDDLADTWDRLKTRVGVATANLIATGARLASELGAALRSAGVDTEFFNQSVASAANEAVVAIARMVEGIRNWISDKLHAIWDGAIAKINQVKKAFFVLADAVVFHSYVPDMVDGIAHEMGRLDTVMVNPALEATKTVADAFMNLGRSIKSGSFLDILGSVIGLGTQLAGVGLFGKGLSARVKAGRVPGYASGTNFHPGGYALVGERGPELVNMPRGTQVTPNGKFGGQTLDIRPSPLFEVYVDGKLVQAAPAFVEAGGRAGVSKVAYQQRRRVA